MDGWSLFVPVDMTSLPSILEPPLVVANHPDRSEIIRCYRENYYRIRDSHRRFPDRGSATHNFELSGNRPVSTSVLTRTVYDNAAHGFVINASLGFILYNNQTRKARYWWPCWNNFGVFNRSVVVRTRSAWDAVAERLSDTQLLWDMSAPRDSSEETAVWITQLYVWIFRSEAETVINTSSV